jgi:hypothetical protein
MQIPSSFKLGKRKYNVTSAPNASCRGQVFPAMGFIELRGDDPYVFWHEVTHAILHDMGDTRWKDEKFVTEFSRRMNQVIKTAEVA